MSKPEPGRTRIPGEIRALFEGKARTPITAFLMWPSYCDQLRAWWRVWRGEHPGAKPPRAFRWLTARSPAAAKPKPTKPTRKRAARAARRRTRGAMTPPKRFARRTML